MEKPSISIPGTLAVMPITHPLDPSMGFLLSSITTVANSMGSPPWITWYGYETLSESSIPAFEKMVHKVAEICARKEQTDQATTTSGWILDVSGKVSWEVILTCCKVFQVDYLLVTAPLDTSSPSSIPWGVTHVQMPPNPFTSPVSLRKYQHIHKIKEYFYGIATQPKWYLSPHFTHLPVSLFTIQLQAPMSMTPSFSMTEVTDGNLLVHSVVAVMDDDEDRSVLGFVYVSEYNESKKRLSMLLPFPGKVPKKTLVLANIKWIELS
ncbi:hypothetical protein HMI56_002420 [Coelomomyces lativittatus]|nr:hypothetical protein HMI56_002420 [Coelomomyces lativittatus]